LSATGGETKTAVVMPQETRHKINKKIMIKKKDERIQDKMF